FVCGMGTQADPGATAAAELGQPVLDATRLAKSYGGHMVLKHVDFSIGAGEIVAVLGENGAGESTFSKIIAGAVQPAARGLRLHGRRVECRSPRDALNVGVAYIPQELAYLSNLTVAENILVGRWPRRAGVTSNLAIRSAAAQEARRYGIAVAVERRMADL